MLKHLDRIYSSATPGKTQLHIESSILLGFAFSDHAPVIARVKAQGRIERPKLYKMNSRQLKDHVLVAKLEALWKDLQVQVLEDTSKTMAAFFKGLYLNCKLTRTHGKLKVEVQWRREKELQAILADVQIRLEDDPNDMEVQNLIMEAEEELNEYINQKIAWLMEATKVRWLEEEGSIPKAICTTFK